MRTVPTTTLTITMALAVAAVALAGCVTPIDTAGVDDAADALDTADATLLCFPRPDGEAACNHEATRGMGPGNEVTIAVNPTDPANIVAGAKDYTPETAGDCVWDGVYVTKDGGRTWMNHAIPGSPWQLLNNGSAHEPTLASQFWCTTDPVVAFGPDGTCYYSFMAYQADPVTASKLGDGVVPMGGLNDWAFNRAAQMVATSTDGCESFDRMSIIADGTFPVNFHDKQWIEVDQETGVVHVVWLDFFVPGNVHYWSDDQARTWNGPNVLATWAGTFTGGATGPMGPAGQGTMVATAPHDRAHVSWQAAGSIWLATSDDGGATFPPAQPVISTEDEGMEAEYRSGGMPFIAVDDTTGPFAGSVYFAWQDTRGGDRDILFARSIDGGETWSEPMKLNDDDTGNDQFFPAISVSPTGVIDAVWYDRRGDPDNRLLDVYYTYSLDGGETWAPNIRVTDVMTDPTLSHHQNGMVFIGDYIDMDSSRDAAHPVWVDTRSGQADAMVASILRPADVVVG